MMMRNLSHCLNGGHQTSVAIGTLKKQCGTCLLCLIVCFLSLPASDPIFKPKSSASITSLRFARGDGWTGEQKYTDNERWVMVICKTRNAEYT